ncbi:MAG TPA: hypothetical protein VD997_17320 [Phycisphaerales bacterium]|nr:hypothetical protein [Phycisphaerales bacterium]
MAKSGVILSVLLWVAVVGAIIFISSLKLQRNERKLWTAGVVMAGFVTQLGMAAWYDSQRRKALNEALTQRGFVPNTADESPAQALHYLSQSEHHSFKAVLSALGTIGDRPAHFAEYQYTIGRGKGSQTFKMAEFAVDVSPAAMPLRLLRRRGVFKKAANLATMYERINKEWQAADGREGEASMKLSLPYYESMLGEAQPTDEQWCVSDGWASLTIRRTVRAEDLDAVYGRVMMFAKIYAPEA